MKRNFKLLTALTALFLLPFGKAGMGFSLFAQQSVTPPLFDNRMTLGEENKNPIPMCADCGSCCTTPGRCPGTDPTFSSNAATNNPVTFTPTSAPCNAASGGTVTSWWDFGDGNTGSSASGSTIMHTYASAGAYTVILCCSCSGGLSPCRHVGSAMASCNCVYENGCCARDNSININPPAPTPVGLLYFNATVENNIMVKCEWATASEQNNDYFAIERSKDGRAFEQIDTVKGAPGGNSTTTRYYKFYDREPYRGSSYYRYKQVDYNNGPYEYSPMRNVHIGTIDIISINSNLSSEYMEYSVSSEGGGEVIVKVIDVLGRELFNSREILASGITTKEISTAALRQGIYLLQVSTKTQFATANPSSGGEKVQKQFVVR